MKDLYIIVNPVSGGEKCHKKLEIAEAELAKAGLPFKKLYSQKAGEITTLTKQAVAEGADCIIIVGGDGTMREAIPSLVNTDTKAFLFPFGTGNDFALAMDIPTEPIECVAKFLNGTVHKLDAGMVNDSYFLNVAGLGFDVEVLIQTERYKKKFKAKFAYMVGLLHALLYLKPHSVTIEHDDKKVSFPMLITSVGNGKFIGGGMNAHPRADAQDGLFDLCAIHDVKKIKILGVLTKFLNGKHLDLPCTYYTRSTQYRIDADTELDIQLDGEIIEKTPAIFKVLPSAINFIL